MAGKTKPYEGKLLATTISTPRQNQQRVKVKVLRAKLVAYEVNIRSFHPNQNFERAGFRFHGDDRGFSLGESWFGTVNKGDVTSRV